MGYNITELENLVSRFGYGSAVLAGFVVALLFFSFEQGVGYLVKKYVPGAMDANEDENNREKDAA